MVGTPGCVLWMKNLDLFWIYILQTGAWALRHTFSAYIIDVYNITALSPQCLWASTIPEVATGTDVHVNLTGVTVPIENPSLFTLSIFPCFLFYLHSVCITNIFDFLHPIHLRYLLNIRGQADRFLLVFTQHKSVQENNNRYLRWILVR